MIRPAYLILRYRLWVRVGRIEHASIGSIGPLDVITPEESYAKFHQLTNCNHQYRCLDPFRAGTVNRIVLNLFTDHTKYNEHFNATACV